MVVWIILGVVAYLVIGGIVNALVSVLIGDDDKFDHIVIFWPMFIGMVAITAAFYGATKFGELTVSGIRYVVTKIRKLAGKCVRGGK